jgi:hypothetical protein
LNKVLDVAAWKVHIFASTGIKAAALDYSAIAVDILDKI